MIRSPYSFVFKENTIKSIFKITQNCWITFIYLLFSLLCKGQREKVDCWFNHPTQVPAFRALTSVLTESHEKHWEMFHRSRHIMQPGEHNIKLSSHLITVLLVLSCTSADKPTALGLLAGFNNSKCFLSLLKFLGVLKYENKSWCISRSWSTYIHLLWASGTASPHFIWWGKTNTCFI